MPRTPLNPLDYTTIQTRITLDMYRYFSVFAARTGITRVMTYMYALKFAYHSEQEFAVFVNEILTKRKGK